LIIIPHPSFLVESFLRKLFKDQKPLPQLSLYYSLIDENLLNFQSKSKDKEEEGILVEMEDLLPLNG
jgi:hypothetical protein